MMKFSCVSKPMGLGLAVFSLVTSFIPMTGLANEEAICTSSPPSLSSTPTCRVSDGRMLRQLLNSLDPVLRQAVSRRVPDPTDEGQVGLFGLYCLSTWGPIRETVIALRTFAHDSVIYSDLRDPLRGQRRELELWADQMAIQTAVAYRYCGQQVDVRLGRIPNASDVQGALSALTQLSLNSRELANSLDQ